MNYLLHGDMASLRGLVRVFQRACREQSVEIGDTRATVILMKVLEDGKKEGLLEETPSPWRPPRP